MVPYACHMGSRIFRVCECPLFSMDGGLSLLEMCIMSSLFFNGCWNASGRLCNKYSWTQRATLLWVALGALSLAFGFKNILVCECPLFSTDSGLSLLEMCIMSSLFFNGCWNASGRLCGSSYWTELTILSTGMYLLTSMLTHPGQAKRLVATWIGFSAYSLSIER